MIFRPTPTPDPAALILRGRGAVLLHKLRRGRMRLSAPAPFRPLTGREWEWLWPSLERFCERDRGRPPRLDLFSRFEAVLEASLHRGRWRDAPGPLKGDTLHRIFRRWAARGLWMDLLRRLAAERPPFPELEYFLCRAFRRATRLQGMAGLLLARRCGLASALRAPPDLLPDPDLSARLRRHVLRPGFRRLLGWSDDLKMAFLDVAGRLLRLSAGRARIRRDWEPA